MSGELEERDKLATVIETAYDLNPGMASFELLAHAVLAAGYRKPQQVTTIEELDELPFGSVILDRSGLSLHKNEFTGWRASNGAKDIGREMLANEALPATVLHVGGSHD